MANRYWVGGTGNWNTTASWSTASGGSSGASVPTSADNVFFDNNSAAGTFTVTIDTTSAVCGAFDASGITNAARKMTLTGTASVGQLTVNGNWINPASTYYAITNWTSAQVNFSASGTITTNSVSFSAAINIAGAGITVTLAGTFTSGFPVTLTNGTFDTSSTGNYALTAGSITVAANSNTRTLALNASSVTLSGASPYTDSSTGGFTLNAGTSTITCSNGSPTLAGNGKTFYNVTFSSGALGTTIISGANTFTNLTFTAASGAAPRNLVFTVNQTVSGTLTLGNPSDARFRTSVYSSNVGTQITLTVATMAAFGQVNFKDIVAAGASAPWSGTNIGNGTNNSNISFATAKTVYLSVSGGASTTWEAANIWALSSTTAGGLTANFPLPQDTVYVDNNSMSASNTLTITYAWWIGTLDFNTYRTNAITLATGTTSPVMYGNLTFNSNLTLSGTGAWFFSGQGKTVLINSSGVVFTQGLIINAPTGTVAIASNTTVGSTLTTTLTAGTLDLTNNGAGNYTLSTGIFSSSNANTRSITFGAGNITITGTSTAGNATVWAFGQTAAFTYTGTPNVYITGNSTANTRTISHGTSGGSESLAVSFIVTQGSDTVTFAGGSNVKNIDFYYAGAGAFTGFYLNAATTTYGNVLFKSGMTISASASVLTFAAATATQTITTAALTLDFPITLGTGTSSNTLQLQDNFTMGSTRTFGHLSGTLDLNNNTATINTFGSTGTGTRAISFGTTGKLTISGSSTSAFTASGSNLTTTGTGIITMTAATAKTFAGGGFTYAATLNQGGAGALTVTGSNGFSGLSNTTQPATITFTAGTTTTFTGAATLAGTAGNLITLSSSTPGTRYTFTYPVSTTTSSLSYTSITDCIGYENAYWRAYQSNGNVNGGNNLGWIFVPMVYTAGGGQFFT